MCIRDRCSILRSTQKTPEMWTTEDIDNILHNGDMLYKHIGKAGRLLPSDLPKCTVIDGVKYHLSEIQSYLGSFTSQREEFRVHTLDVLREAVVAHNMFVLCIGDSAISITQTTDMKYYIFDSHSRNIAGFPTPNGTAAVSYTHLTLPTKRIV